MSINRKSKRKTQRMKVFVLSFVLLLSGICSGASTAHAEKNLWPDGISDSSIAAESAILMDVNSGAVLYEKNSTKAQYPASITKVMTCLIAIENSDMNEIVDFSANAVYGIEPGSAHIAAEVDERMTMEQCLYGMLLPSANEVCLAVAEHVGGSVEGFAEMMNAKAAELGCVNTHFSNPNGLHDDNHYTCANDMALIARAAFQHEIFQKVCGTQYYTMAPTNKKEERGLLNNHQMVYGWKYPQYQYEYCVGGKTGYTDQSLWTLVTYAQKDDITLVTVVMRDWGPTYPENEYTDSTAMFEYGFEHFYMHQVNSLTVDNELVQEESPLFTRFSPLFAENGSGIYMTEGGSVILPNDADISKLKQTVTYYEEPLVKNGETVIGQVTHKYGGKIVGQNDIKYAQNNELRLTTRESKATEVEADIVDTQEQKNLKPALIFVICGVVFLIAFLCFIVLTLRKRQDASFSFSKSPVRRKGSSSRRVASFGTESRWQRSSKKKKRW